VRRGLAGDLDRAADDIEEHVAPRDAGEFDVRARLQIDRRHEDVEQRLHAAFAAEILAGDEVYDRFAVGRRDRRDLVALQADVPRLRHLQTRRQVDPKLQDL
jgi:hypothetical protein